MFALTIDEDLEGEVRPFGDPGCAARRRDGPALRASVSDERGPRDRRAGRVLYYHNVTLARPTSAPYDAGLFRLAVLARREPRKRLRCHVDLALGVSEFNRQGVPRGARLLANRGAIRN